MKSYNLSSIMSEAHRMASITGASLSDSLKKAWMNEKLNKSMKTRIVHFFYQKISGEIREAYGTLQDRYIDGLVLGTGHKNRDCRTYYDTVAGGFRSYKSYNIISVC